MNRRTRLPQPGHGWRLGEFDDTDRCSTYRSSGLSCRIQGRKPGETGETGEPLLKNRRIQFSRRLIKPGGLEYQWKTRPSGAPGAVFTNVAFSGQRFGLPGRFAHSISRWIQFSRRLITAIKLSSAVDTVQGVIRDIRLRYGQPTGATYLMHCRLFFV